MKQIPLDPKQERAADQTEYESQEPVNNYFISIEIISQKSDKISMFPSKSNIQKGLLDVR